MIKTVNKTNVNPVDASYPYADVKNDTGSNDGTPVDRELLADYVQFFERLAALSGITINDLPDNDTNGFQLSEALLAVTKPRPYKVHSALISQVGAAAPTEDAILETELSGSIVWVRTGVGTYSGTLVNEWTSLKTWFKPPTVTAIGAEVHMLRISDDVIEIRTFAGGIAADDVLNFAVPGSFEIRVYD